MISRVVVSMLRSQGVRCAPRIVLAVWGGSPARRRPGALLDPEHERHAHHRQHDQKGYDASGAHSFVVLYDPQARQWIVTL